MKNLIGFLVIFLVSTSAWSATVTGNISSIEVKWDFGVNAFRHYVTLQGNPQQFFLEARDGRSQAIVDAQYALLLAAFTMGNPVTFETDYNGYTARIRDIKVSK